MKSSLAFPITSASGSCTNCRGRNLCLAGNATPDEQEVVDALRGRIRNIPSGGCVFHTGEKFRALYAVRQGWLKLVSLSEDGSEHVLGFALPGALLGLDAIAGDRHIVEARALEDAQVCQLMFGELEVLGGTCPSLMRRVMRSFSEECVREQAAMLVLGSLRASRKVAAFLLDLIEKLDRLGLVTHEVCLRMSREDIGSYLGLTLETVSRTFSAMHRHGVLEVHQKRLLIHDLQKLRRLAGRSMEQET